MKNKETLEEVIGREFQFHSSTEIKDEKPVYLIDKHSFKIAVDNILKWQAERIYSDLSELRNDLYDKLPIGDVDAFEILKVIKNHLQKLDVLCGKK